MRPEFEKISQAVGKAFSRRKIVRKSRPFLSQAWHFHPEIELCYTLKSQGKRYVGNAISNYSEGDIVLIGPNVPHGFTTSTNTEQYVIQFTSDFAGEAFLNLSELRPIKELLLKSRRGIVLHGGLKSKIQELTKLIFQKEGFQSFLMLLEILNTIAASSEYEQICSDQYSTSIRAGQLSRIKKVFKYIENNFQKDISVDDVRKCINLTEPAFYKFIKRHTKRKFTEILNEYRIAYASKQLINSSQTIAEICYASGYNNLSYFNRKFKDMMGRTPKEFRALYK